MKKFLVLCVSAAMLLSTAAASLAAATVTGDFRYNMYEDDSKTDKSYADTDLYLRASGNLSDSVYATANLEFFRDNSTAAGALTTKLDEFFVTSKYSWGTAKMGYYEYKFTPSRVEMKTGHMHVWQKSDATFEVNVPLANGFSIDGIVQPYKNGYADDGAYGLAVNYKAENWGAKVSYADFGGDYNNFGGDLTAIDAYYQVNEDMKVFVDMVDYSVNDKKYATAGGTTSTYDKNGIDGVDPLIGFQWNKIGGTKLFASIEYGLNKRYEDTSKEYTEYVLKASYKLDNNIGLEFYHYVVGDGQNKDKFRIRYQF